MTTWSLRYGHPEDDHYVTNGYTLYRLHHDNSTSPQLAE